MNVEEIKELIQTFAESGLEEIEAELDGNRLYLKRSADVQAQAAPANIPGFCPNTVYTGPGMQIGQGACIGTQTGPGAQIGQGACIGAQAGPDAQIGQTVYDITNGSGGTGRIGADGSGTVKSGAAADGAGEANTEMVKAPLVGIFYEAPAPGEEPFVKEGQKVKKGDVLCVIEAMKMMNELKADVDGTVKKVDVKNGDAVEFGQVLFEVERC